MSKITWILPTVEWDESVLNSGETAMEAKNEVAAIGGFIKQDSVELLTIDGETKEARDVKGEIIDRVKLDQNYELNLTLIGQSLAEMAGVLGLSTSAPLKINNTMLKGHRYVVVTPEEEGQIQAVMPYCRVFTGIGYNGADGYYMPLRIVPMIPPTKEARLKLVVYGSELEE